MLPGAMPNCCISFCCWSGGRDLKASIWAAVGVCAETGDAMNPTQASASPAAAARRPRIPRIVQTIAGIP
jgi:hypothetical protein